MKRNKSKGKKHHLNEEETSYRNNQHHEISNRYNDDIDRFFNNFETEDNFFRDFGMMRRMDNFGHMRDLMK